MMRLKTFFFISALLLTAGCDPLYKIPIGSTYSYDVSVTFDYSDGRVEKMIWPACKSKMIGRPSVSIERIIIEKDNATLLTLSYEEVKALEEKFSQVHDAA